MKIGTPDVPLHLSQFKQEQERVNALQRADAAVCSVCHKRFTKATRHLTAGQIGLTHECGTGHLVRPVSR